MKQAELDGTHKPGVICNRCGQRSPGHWEFVERGSGLAPQGICVACAALAGDEQAIRVVAKQAAEVPM
jgi:hypothetical protein